MSEKEFRRRTPEEVWDQLKSYRVLERVRAGEPVERIAPELGMHPSTLRRWLKRLGLEFPERDPMRILTERKMEAQAEEAQKAADLAMALGLTLVNRHKPLLDHLLSQGKSPEAIMEDMVDWFQQKAQVEARLGRLEGEIGELEEEVERLSKLAEPNVRYYLKLQAYLRYFDILVRAQLLGAPLDAQALLEGLKRDLELIDSATYEQLYMRAKKALTEVTWFG